MRPRSSRSPRPPAPVSIDGYDVHERIGSGGFSTVYRAHQRSMGREVAVKVLNIGFATVEEQQQFVRECHALGRLSHHPNIVTVFSEVMTADGRPCIVMELYSQTYRDRLGDVTQLPLEEVLSVGIRICGALQAAHDAGVMHRDLKPHNVFLSAYGEPALGDFGISTIDNERSTAGGGSLSIAYAAPEILEEGRPTVVADVYSLAATLFQLIEGASPFASSDMKTAVRRILTEAPPALRNAEAPPGLQRVLHRALAKDPAVRPQSAIEFAEALREVQARAGFTHTPIPRISIAEPPLPSMPSRSTTPLDRSEASPADTTSPRARATRPETQAAPLTNKPTSTAPAPAPPRTVPHADPERRMIEESGELGSVTVARSRPASSKRRDRRVTPSDPIDRSWRRFVGPSALLALLLVGGAVVVATRGGSSDGPIEPDRTTVPADPPFEDVLPPTGVQVTAVEGGFNVEFVASTDATSTEIQQFENGALGDVVVGRSPVLIATDATTLCVQLQSFGSRGRVSQTVGPVCSG